MNKIYKAPQTVIYKTNVRQTIMLTGSISQEEHAADITFGDNSKPSIENTEFDARQENRWNDIW